MTRTFPTFTAALVAVSLAASASAGSLASNAGIDPAEAKSMTLTEIAQHKFNRGVSYSDRQAVVIPATHGGGDRSQLAASAGLSPEAALGMSLNALAIAKFNSDTRRDDRQGVIPPSQTTVVSRSFGGPPVSHRQLVRSAGLTQRQADGMTVTEIVRHKFNGGVSYSDLQRTID
jgi:hypothetical protein